MKYLLCLDRRRNSTASLAGTAGSQPYDFFFRIAKYMVVAGKEISDQSEKPFRRTLLRHPTLISGAA
jgi:hypothetical protein